METKEQFLARYQAAVDAGASEAELQAMRRERLAQVRRQQEEDARLQQEEAERKKKEQEEAERLRLEQASEVDFGESTLASPAQAPEPRSGDSDSPPVVFNPHQNYEFQGRQIPGADAQMVYDYGQAYESERRRFIDENFDLETYYNSKDLDTSRLEGLSEEQLEQERQSTIEAIEELAKNNVNAAQGEFGKGIEATVIPEENRRFRAEFEETPAINIWGSRAGVEQMTGISTRLFEQEIEGLGLSEEATAARYKEFILNKIDRTSNNNIFSYINGQVEQEATKKFQETLGQDLTLEQRRAIEQNLFRNYDISTDLTGEGYVNESGQGWLGVTDVFSPGFKSGGLAIWDGIATAAENALGGNEEAQARRQQQIADIRKEMATSVDSMSEKFSEGDLGGWFSDTVGMVGASIPIMTGALVTGAVSRGNMRAVMSVTSTLGAASVYSDNKDTDWYKNLSGSEALGFVVSSGIAEGLPAAVGANIFKTGGFLSKGLRGVMGQAVAEGGEQSFKQWTKGLLIGAGLGAVEEGITEGITAGWQYTSRIQAMQAGGEDVQWNYKDFWEQTKEGAVAGMSMGGALSASGTVLRTVASKGIDLVKTTAVIKELQQSFTQAESKQERAAIGKKIVEAVNAFSKLSERRVALMEELEQSNPEAYKRLVEIHNRVEILAEKYTRADRTARAGITKEVRKLLDERGTIEGEMDAIFETDGKVESQLLARAARKAGKRRSNYGGLFEDGRGKVTVSTENFGSVAQIISKLTEFDVSPFTTVTQDGKERQVTSGARIVKGVQNAMNVVKAMSSLGDFQFEIYKDFDTMVEDLMEMETKDPETGEVRKMNREEATNMIARGLYIGQGKAKLFLPGMLENTAYHEGYHDFVIQSLGTQASVGLAKKLFQALPDNLKQRYGNFLKDYGDGTGDLTGTLRNKNVNKGVKVESADEFLMEFLADLSAGNISVDIQKSAIRKFMEFLSPHLGRIGVRDIPSAKIEDVVSAVNRLTSDVREGRRIDSIEQLRAATIRANYAGIAMKAGIISDDDAEDGFDETKKQAMESGGNKIFATVVFKVSLSGKANWPVKKVFENQAHLDNFVSYMERNRGWKFDELYVHEGEYNSETRQATRQKSEPIRETRDATSIDIIDASDAKGINFFARSMDRAMKMMAERGINIGLQVTQLSEEDVQKIVDEGGTIFMTSDYGAGGYITKEGYVGGIFKNPDSVFKRITKPMFAWMEAWAAERDLEIFFDAFATELEDIYIGLGYKPVGRTSFNREYAPEGWDAENSPLLSEPDVVFFTKGEGKKGDGVRYDDYMEAYDVVSNSVKKPKAQSLPDPALEQNAPVPFQQAANVSEGQMAERRKEIKLPESQRQRRNSVVLDVLNKYELGEITQEDYLRAVRENMPIKPFETVPEIPTVLDVASSLTSDKVTKGIIGVNKELPDGYYVGLRLDIPAYDTYDTWVVSVHQGKRAEERTPFLGGKAIGYGQTAVITNATFDSTPMAALNIARGKGKQTIARMFGDYKNESPESVYQRAVDIMNGSEYNSDYKQIGKMEGWIQVGMNPFRHSWFYDKRDGRPIAESSEVIQVGALVLAKDAVKISESDERFNAKSRVSGQQVKFQRVGSQGVDPVALVKRQELGIFNLEFSATTTQMDEWLASGTVRTEDLSMLKGRAVLSHSPDNMMVGTASVDDRVIARNGGGFFYSANTGDVWAVAGESAGKNMAAELNKLLKESPDGKAYMLLISGGRMKHRSSTNGVVTFANLGLELVNQGVLTKTEYKNALKKAIALTEERSIAAQIKANEAKVKKGQKADPLKRGTAKLSSMAGSIEALMQRFFEEFASAKKSTFEQRREFAETFGTVLGEVVKAKASQDAATKADIIAKYEKMFEAKPNMRQFGSFLKNFFFDYFQEKVLQGVEPNQIYGAIEVTSDVKLERDPNPLASYPLKLVNVDSNAPAPKTIVFKTMNDAISTLESRDRNIEQNNRLGVGDMKLDAKGKLSYITKQAFQMMGGMGQATWGRMFVKEAIPVDAISREVKSVSESVSVVQSAKAQGNLMKLIADMVDPAAPTPGARVNKRGKLIITPSKSELWNRKKSEVIELLTASGMSKENAEALYAAAKAYKEGRTAGRKAAEKAARNTLGKRNQKLSTESKRLKEELDKLKSKAKTVDEFFGFAVKLINERMKELGTVPFSNKDVQRLMKIARQAHKASAARIKKEGGAEVMDTFVEKLIDIFDKKDSQKAMANYLASVSAARKLQQSLRRVVKSRKKGEALKSTASYSSVVNKLAGINPALISPADMGDFLNTLAAATSSVTKVKTKFDTEEQRVVAEAPQRISVEALEVLANKFKALEEIGRNAVMVAKARAAAAKNNTSFDEEYDKLVKAFERGRLSATRKAILDFMDKNPALNLDPANPADVEFVLGKLAEDKADLLEQQKDAIITDVIIPRIFGNLDKLLEDQHIAEVLGIFAEDGFDPQALRQRLNKLDKITLASLEFKLDDYIMNDSVMGLGYLAARVRGKIEMADKIDSELVAKGIGAVGQPFLALFDTADSFIRLIFPQGNKTIAEIRNYIGFAQMERAFAKADMIHAMTVEAITDEMTRIEKEGGSLRSVKDNAIMQVFSMARQMPMLEEGAPGQNAAEWYLNLRDAMKRSIEHYSEQKDLYSKEEIQEMQEAFDYLFSEPNLEGLIDKVTSERADLTEFVDFMVNIHGTQQDTFANYVERYLGKTLKVESNYTPFQVKTKVRNEAVDEQLGMRQAIMDSMRTSSLANAKKVAGSSYERNPKSISGGNNIIGLNFLKINERTLRENTILTNTVGDVMALQGAFASEAMTKLIKDDGTRKQLHSKMMQYITQDAGQAPVAFQSTISIKGRKVFNPLTLVRNAVVVKAFGSLIIQTMKQSTVAISVMSNAERPTETIPYFIQTIGELWAHALRNGLFKDSKLALEANGRYKLLQNSPVFSRDYEAGNIDPYTGSIQTETNWFQRTQDKLTSVALQNLKSTDKVVAVSSWFAFYADYLLSEGIVDSIADIDWQEQAGSPNQDALSYADSMVTKDQAASTPRQAADVYKDDGGALAPAVAFVRNVVLPFARFAVNKKRSIYSDFRKIKDGDSATKREGYRLMAGHMAELAMFHTIGQVLIPAVAQLLAGEDEEESEFKDSPMLNVAASVVIDMLPLPPVGYSDDLLKEFANYAILFKLPQMMGDESLQATQGESDAEMFERMKRTRPTIRTYHQGAELSATSAISMLMGPYGQFINDAANIVENLAITDNRVISSTGREYFVRPEDKDRMDIHHGARFLLALSQIAGFSSKELDVIVRRMDDLPRERSFNSEEELAAYELIMQGFRQEDELASLLGDEAGAEKFARILQEKTNMSPYEAQRTTNRYKRGLVKSAAEEVLREYPGYSKHIRDIRSIDKASKDAKDYYIIVNRRKEQMPAEDYAEFKYLADTYMALLRRGMLEETLYYNITE